jgi:hypothetical protein
MKSLGTNSWFVTGQHQAHHNIVMTSFDESHKIQPENSVPNYNIYVCQLPLICILMFHSLAALTHLSPINKKVNLLIPAHSFFP